MSIYKLLKIEGCDLEGLKNIFEYWKLGREKKLEIILSLRKLYQLFQKYRSYDYWIQNFVSDDLREKERRMKLSTIGLKALKTGIDFNELFILFDSPEYLILKRYLIFDVVKGNCSISDNLGLYCTIIKLLNEYIEYFAKLNQNVENLKKLANRIGKYYLNYKYRPGGKVSLAAKKRFEQNQG